MDVRQPCRPDANARQADGNIFRVTVDFEFGTEHRTVVWARQPHDREIYLFALTDMRTSAGAGLVGKVLRWKVEPLSAAASSDT
ncbi:hypothetical protein GCM10011572_51560 [Pseudoduganella buxea]|uniref:Uncharacterized protein n=1 Tax=Pseudoduganella buxea TaxID=1949069 RepID=A0ABQ1LKV9_9BURK|nr:hypothetical protein GCM10011572_51560 [Pseudoduganella buxea]